MCCRKCGSARGSRYGLTFASLTKIWKSCTDAFSLWYSCPPIPSLNDWCKLPPSGVRAMLVSHGVDLWQLGDAVRLLMGLTMAEIKQESGFNPAYPIIMFETAHFQVAYVPLGYEHIAHLLFRLHPPGCDFVSF